MCAQWSVKYRCHVSYLLITSQLIMQFHFSITSNSLIPDRVLRLPILPLKLISPHLYPNSQLPFSVVILFGPLIIPYYWPLYSCGNSLFQQPSWHWTSSYLSTAVDSLLLCTESLSLTFSKVYILALFFTRSILCYPCPNYSVKSSIWIA